MQTLTVPLGAESWPKAVVGGKADGLHRLIRAGFSVPPGFCVTAHAFEGVVRDCVGRVDDLEGLRAALREVDVPEELAEAVRLELRKIGAERWAVRSSALEEDDERFSFAGQQRTVLDVESVEGVLDAMRDVWAGLYDLEGLLYRSRLRVDVRPRPMAVVVQAMVESSVGGVAFTENPVAGADDDEDLGDGEVWITASEKGAEAVVRGSSGDHYRVDRASGRRLEGPEEGPLGASRLDELVSEVEAIESEAGGPVDVEWSVGWIPGLESPADERLHLLQARPVTARSDAEGAESVWSNVNVGEALPGVATPFTWSIIGKFSRKGFERAFATLGLTVPEDYELVGSFRGRVYLNLTQFVSVASGIPILEPDVLFEMAGGGGLEWVEEAVRDRSPLGFLLRLPATISRIVIAQAAMPLAAPLWSRYFGAQLEAFFDRDFAGLSHGELRAELDRVDALFERTGLLMLTCSSNFLMSYVIMKKSLDWFGRSGAVERERELFEALEVQSAEPVLDLLELARLARDSEIEALFQEQSPHRILDVLEAHDDVDEVAEFLDAFDAFRDEHGHRAPREAELSTPRWREESTFVFEMLQEYLERDELPAPEEYRREWSRRRDRVDRIVDETFDPISGKLFRVVLWWARATARIREFMRTHVVESLDLYREFALECGERLAAEGVLGRPEDVFYLRYEELRRWLEGENSESERELALRVLVRRALVEALRDLPDPPGSFVLCDHEMISEDAYRRRDGETEAGSSDRTRAVLHGLPGSRGRVTGPARVIRDLETGGRVEEGEILVAPYTDVGWTPLFLTASAIVMGLGGPLSHACIVAREFGIPTVVNAGDVTDVIETGDRITVDGDEGIVIVHER